MLALVALPAITPATIRVLMLYVHWHLAESATASILSHMRIPQHVLHASRAKALVATGAAVAPASRLNPPATQGVRLVVMFVVLALPVAAKIAVACAMPTMQIVDVNFPFNVEICLSTGFLMHSSS